MRPGWVIANKYRVDSMLGEGAMGKVWLATHVNLGQRVAVKLISSDHAKSKEARARFDSEAKSAAALRSRFVVQIFDSGVTDDGMPYIVMEYLNGESLEDRVDRAGPLVLEHAVRVVGQVGKALSRAHANNIVHRDLKPANIFLAQTEDGEEVAKVLDFGIAKVLGRDPTQSATATGAILGTPLYMSPEQARGLKTVDHRTDLYALGMVAYYMLTGTTAVQGESFGDLILAICTKELPAIHHVAPWLPPTIDEWFKRACSRDPNARYESADELVSALAMAAELSTTQLNVAELGASVGYPRPARIGTSPAALVQTNADPVTGNHGTVGPAATTGGLAAGQDPVVLPKKSALPVVLVVGLVGFLAIVGLGAFVIAGAGDTKSTPEGSSAAVQPAQPPEPAEPAAAKEPNEKPAVEPAAKPEPSASVKAETAPKKDAEEPRPSRPSHAPVKPRPEPRHERPAKREKKPPKKPAAIDMGF